MTVTQEKKQKMKLRRQRRKEKRRKQKAEEASAIKKKAEEAAAIKKKAEAKRANDARMKALEEAKRCEEEKKAKEAAAAKKKAEEQAAALEFLQVHWSEPTKSTLIKIFFTKGEFKHMRKCLMQLLHPGADGILFEHYQSKCAQLAIDFHKFFVQLESGTPPASLSWRPGMVVLFFEIFESQLNDLMGDVSMGDVSMLFEEENTRWKFHQVYVMESKENQKIYACDPFTQFGGPLLEDYVPFFMTRISPPFLWKCLILRFCWDDGDGMVDDYTREWVIPNARTNKNYSGYLRKP